MPSRDQFFTALGSLPAAVALLTALRWPTGIICPYCGSGHVGGHGRYARCRDLPRYHCKACHRTFLLTTGMANLPSYLKLHQFRRNERERPYREQACLLLATLLGVGRDHGVCYPQRGLMDETGVRCGVRFVRKPRTPRWLWRHNAGLS